MRNRPTDRRPRGGSQTRIAACASLRAARSQAVLALLLVLLSLSCAQREASDDSVPSNCESPFESFSDGTALSLVSAATFPWCPEWIAGSGISHEGELGGWAYRVVAAGRPRFGQETDVVVQFCGTGGFFEEQLFIGQPRPIDSCTGADLNRDGAPDLVLTTQTGGMHCCALIRTFSLKVDVIESLGALELDNAPVNCADLDDDGRREMWFPNAEFFLFGFHGNRPDVSVPTIVGFNDSGDPVASTGSYKELLRELLDEVIETRPTCESDGCDPQFWDVWESALRRLLGEGPRAWRPLARGRDERSQRAWREKILGALRQPLESKW